MDIIKLEGDDRRLYYLVAHLVMDEEVLGYNLNYPYKTSSGYIWFVATDNGDTLGFMPVKLEEGKAKINNYYVAGDDHTVFSALLKTITNALSFDYEIESVTQLRHIPDFERHGFLVALYWKRYARMKVHKDEKEQERL